MSKTDYQLGRVPAVPHRAGGMLGGTAEKVAMPWALQTIVFKHLGTLSFIYKHRHRLC